MKCSKCNLIVDWFNRYQLNKLSCIYKDNKCYIEHELENTKELEWLEKNTYKYGFVLRYPKEKEDITGYDYEPWHYRFVANLSHILYKNNLTLEEYLEIA